MLGAGEDGDPTDVSEGLYGYKDGGSFPPQWTLLYPPMSVVWMLPVPELGRRDRTMGGKPYPYPYPYPCACACAEGASR